MAKVFIQQQFPQVMAELVHVQRELQEVLIASSDPVVERQARHRREALERRRRELLDGFGRLGLSWMMLGGAVNLVRMDSRAAGHGSAASAASTQAAQAEAKADPAAPAQATGDPTSAE